MKCGQVVLIEYPHTDQAGSSVRPALVVSSTEYNEADDLVLVPISSRQPSNEKFTFALPDTAAFRSQTGLKRRSFVKWTKLFTITKSLIMRRLGELPPAALGEVRSRIQTMFE